MMVDSRKVYIIFEGGGAKGIPYVGAINTLFRDDRFEIQGVGGASAGAISAAFLASGMTPTQIENATINMSIGDILDEESFDAWGGRINELAEAVSAKISRPFRLLGWFQKYKHQIDGLATGRGAFGTQKLREWLNNQLGSAQHVKNQMAGRGAAADEDVLFRDLKHDLRVVTTNVDSRTMVVFDSEQHAEMSVAEVVCASAAIPTLFQPVKIGDFRYVDGGVTSNFPFFLFDRERIWPEGYQNAVLGFQIQESVTTDGQGNGSDESLVTFGRNLLDSAISGTAASLEHFDVRNFHPIGLKTRLGLLDFAAEAELKKLEIKKGEEQTANFLSDKLALAPLAKIQPILVALRLAVKHVANLTDSKVRTNIMAPITSTSNPELMVCASENMADDSDDKLILSASDGVSGQAFNSSWDKIVTGRTSMNSGGVGKYIGALVNPELEAIVSCPIFPLEGSETPVVTLDCDASAIGVLSLDYCGKTNIRKFESTQVYVLIAHAAYLVSHTTRIDSNLVTNEENCKAFFDKLVTIVEDNDSWVNNINRQQNDLTASTWSGEVSVGSSVADHGWLGGDNAQPDPQLLELLLEEDS